MNDKLPECHPLFCIPEINIRNFALDVEEETSTLLTFDVVDMDKGVQESLLESINREGMILYEEI